MTAITTSWTKVKEVYVGNDGYHDVYWRMYARYSGTGTKTVYVEGRLYLTGSTGSLYCGATTTTGGIVGNYSQWGINKVGTYYPGETTLWSGSDTTTGSSISAGVRFYSSPWGWTGDNLYLSDTLTFTSPTTPPNTPTISIGNVTANSVTVTYGTTSFGNPSTGVVTLYGGTSAAPTTTINTTNTTGDKTFVYTGLTPETTYYFRARANNGQLNSNYSTEISVITPFDRRFYGSVNNQTKKIAKLYGSVNGQTKEIIKLYGSVNGQTKRIF